ncbi:MAG: Hsp20 family protein [Alphaproteobacteria bacterium]
MRTYDLTPLFRSTVGFDRWNDLFDTVFGGEETAATYPPYNIEKLGEDNYRVTLAVAGFSDDDLNITVQENLLVVSGKRSETRDKDAKYLYRGIANRAFERKFSLADHVRVKSATLTNGMLTIELVRELPEAMKPRQIAIETAPVAGKKVIEGAKAA